MKMPKIHLTVNGESLCGKTEGYGTPNTKVFKKSLSPCYSCLKIYESRKSKKP